MDNEVYEDNCYVAWSPMQAQNTIYNKSMSPTIKKNNIRVIYDEILKYQY